MKWYVNRHGGTDGPQKAYWAEEIYIFLMTVLLVVGWLVVGDNSEVNNVALVIAIVRGAEVFGVALGLVLVKETVEVAKKIFTVALYGLQVPLILAIVTHVKAANAFTDAKGAHPTSAVDFLYLSWTNVTTLGNKYVPTTDLAKALVVISGASGLILLGVFLTLAVNRIGGADSPAG